MLETIVSLITIATAVFGFFKWGLPHLRRYFAKRRVKVRKISISLREKSIDENNEFLEQLLLNQKRDTFLNKPLTISVHDKELDKFKAKLNNLDHKDQASLAAYISSSEDKIKCVNSMFALLFDKKILKMLDALFFTGADFALVARGSLKLMDGNVTGTTKLDVWCDSEPKVCFGIYITPEEKLLVEKTTNMPVSTILGPGRLSASELPKEIIARHIVPRLLFEITRSKDKLIPHSEKLFLLFNYHVGLG